MLMTLLLALIGRAHGGGVGRSAVYLTIAAVTLACLSRSDAATLVVENTSDGGAGSLRQMLSDAQDNDTIAFAENVRGTITLESGELVVDKPLTIRGPGANVLAITANGRSRVLRASVPGGAVSISGLTFADGRAPDSWGGGCIVNFGHLTLTQCTISGGSSISSFSSHGRGGGISNAEESVLTMIGCTLTANRSQGGRGSGRFGSSPADGGALYNSYMATATLLDCTISGNSAVGGAPPEESGCSPFFCPAGAAPGRGGGISNAGGVMLVERCTIASNSVADGDGGGKSQQSAGGGISNTGSGLMRIRGSIVAGNTSAAGAPDVSGNFESEGFNLVGKIDGSGGFSHSHDQSGTIAAPLDPKLSALQDNGGPTLTMALLPGSPALDRGIGGEQQTDQRGLRRSVDFANVENGGGDASDIGAFEFQRRGLLNISTRMRVLTGERALIAGFIVAPGAPKELIVRGVGPSLAIGGALLDPTIEIFEERGFAVAFNDDWREAETAADIERTLPPAHESESALWGIINPGTYTTVLRGRNNTSGIGLVETYDLDPTVDSGFANISSRGFVGTGDDVLIAGIIVGPQGAGSTRVVLRAIGPSMATGGVDDALSDPMLDVRDGEGNIVAVNDDWQSGPTAAEIAQLQLAPNDSRESATLQVLAPGTYTAIVRGNFGGTGIGLVEAYDVGPVESSSAY